MKVVQKKNELNNNGLRWLVGTAATISWVHPKSAVGTFVKDIPPAPFVQAKVFCQPQHYRFANFLHCWVSTFDSRTINNYGFQQDSKIYPSSSFGHFPSKLYPLIQESRRFLREDGVEGVEFSQIAGARTVSHAFVGALTGLLFGGVIGCLFGLHMAARMTNYPPIWTHLRLTIFANGERYSSLVEFSDFPSNILYTVQAGNPKPPVFKAVSSYQALTREQRIWEKHGWQRANPWGIAKPTLKCYLAGMLKQPGGLRSKITFSI